MELYGTINNVKGGARNNLHVLRKAEHTSCDALPTKRAVVEWICRPSVHLTGSKYKQRATASVKVRRLNAFFE